MSQLKRSAAPLREQATAAIRASIIAGEYLQGERLKEKDLCEALGVSRTVVREALRQLESEHLVEIIPQTGPVVHRMTREEAEKLYEVRAALEGLIARLAAERHTAEDLTTLRATLEELREHPETLVRFLELKNRFSDELVVASHNPVAGDMLANVQARVSQLRTISFESTDRYPNMLAELHAVVDAVEAGDSAAAEAAAITHVNHAAELAMDRLHELTASSSLREATS